MSDEANARGSNGDYEQAVARPTPHNMTSGPDDSTSRLQVCDDAISNDASVSIGGTYTGTASPAAASPSPCAPVCGDSSQKQKPGADVTSSANGPAFSLEEALKMHRDTFGFFILGVLTDSVPGFILSGTMLNYLVPEDNQSILATSATVGAMTSASLTALLLYRIKPDIRVAMLQCLQVGGMLTTWMAPYWINMIGVCVLMFGNFGAMTTLLPLTVFKAKKTSRAFQFGSSLAPIYWSTIINAGTASGLDVPGLFIVALCMLPVSAAAYFLVLDRSTWNSKVPHLPTSATTLKTGGVEAVTNGGDDDTPHGPADVVVSSGSIGNVNFQEAQGLTLRQRFAAMREASFYIWLTVANFLNYALYNTSIQTYFVASSASYYGVEAVGLLNRILLVSFCFAAVLGTTTLVPSIAKRVPRGVLWAPIVFQSGCVVLAWLQVGGVIPPMPLWAVYLVSLTIWGVFFLVQFQAPLFLREDERMQSINREVQIQALFVTQYATRLVQNIVAVTFISHFNLGLCETHVAATTPGVNCLLT